MSFHSISKGDLMSDNPYAAFGVHNAVLSSDTIEEHKQNMLDADVSVRDGDDEIQLTREPEVHDDAGVVVTDLVEDELGTEDKLEVKITDGEFDEAVDDPDAEESEATDAETDAESDQEFTPLGEIPDELTATSKQISEHAEGFKSMKESAIKAGLPVDVAAAIEAEYEGDGELSEASLKALEDAGYGRAFVQSYIRGQESLAEQYVARVMDFAGGKDKFNVVIGHLQANSPESVEALEDAIQRQDIKAVKSIVNLAMASQVKKFGTKPARSVTAKAPASAAKPSAPKVEGFKNSDEMVKAMGDRRYQTDPAYRNSVRDKVARSNF